MGVQPKEYGRGAAVHRKGVLDAACENGGRCRSSSRGYYSSLQLMRRRTARGRALHSGTAFSSLQALVFVFEPKQEAGRSRHAGAVSPRRVGSHRRADGPRRAWGVPVKGGQLERDDGASRISTPLE